MIVTEKTGQILCDNIQILFKRRYKFNKKKGIISSEKRRISGNYIYDYAHSFFGEEF